VGRREKPRQTHVDGGDDRRLDPFRKRLILEYSSSASRMLASASSKLSPWLVTSTSRQRATYQGCRGRRLQ
jgi:hypothetical protein